MDHRFHRTLLALLTTLLVTCSSGTIVTDDCENGVFLEGACRPFDCPDHDCPDGFVCAVNRCVEIACVGVPCSENEACAGGECYPKDCVWRTCPGIGEVCIGEECLQASCLEVECPPGQRCASGQCYPIDCETKDCPGYGEVCIEGECIGRTCVGVECPPLQRCAGGICYPSDCTDGGCFSEGEVCIDGVCQRRACVDVECSDGYGCANGWCYPLDCPGMECSDYGEVCFEDECIHADCVGVECPSGERCARGECFSELCGQDVCEPDEVCFQDVCIRQNCVGVQCPPGQRCADGTCVASDCTQAGVQCGQGEICIDGNCVPEDCAHVACPPGEVCGADGECYPEDCTTDCGPYGLCLDGVCVDRMCVGVTCPPGQVCAGGNCYETDCDGTACGAGEVCENGTCVPVECVNNRCCPAADCTLDNQCALEQCDGQSYICLYDGVSGVAVWSESGTTCTDSNPCTTGDACLSGTCAGNDIVCDDPPANHCDGDDRVYYPPVGTCSGGVCDYPEGRESCNFGCENGMCKGDPCGPITCDPGEQCSGGQCYCGGTGPDCTAAETCCGTECFDLQNDPENCGNCGNVCRRDHATAECVGGGCRIASCDALWGNCDGSDANGCETSLETLQNCNACGTTCSRDHASESCSGGTCRITTCDTLWGNCDGNDANGCETPLNTLSDCGDCDTPCALPHATPSCTGGSCHIESCDPSYWNVNAQESDGCECGDVSETPDTCGSAIHVGDIDSGTSSPIERTGVLVHRAGVREDDDCFHVNYLSPPPGDGTLSVSFVSDPGNLGLEVRMTDCASSPECPDPEPSYSSWCQSTGGGACLDGNSNNFYVCVTAAAGASNVCSSYTLRFEYLP